MKECEISRWEKEMCCRVWWGGWRIILTLISKENDGVGTWSSWYASCCGEVAGSC
jgi:hypothetical protein